MAEFAPYAITALTIGTATGLLFRVWALLPIAGAIVLAALGAGLTSNAASCAAALITLQGGFLLGGCLRGARASATG